jgi:hypothetical protein
MGVESVCIACVWGGGGAERAATPADAGLTQTTPPESS